MALVGILFFWIGLYAIVSQVALFREMAVIFLGHEISFGLSFAAWLVWGGVGSFANKGVADPKRRLSLIVGILSIAVPLSVVAIRLSKLLVPSGTLPGLFPALIFPFILFLAPCWLFGAAFSCGAAVARQDSRMPSPGRIYFFESAGAFAGGILSTYVLLGNVPGLLTLAAGGLILAGLSWFFLRPGQRALTIASIALGLIFTGFSSTFDLLTRQVQWKGYKIIQHTESRYEHLALARLKGMNILFHNGIISSQFPDPGSQEELVHWPLLAHANPRSVLALGVNSAISLAEILKHPIASVDLVEPDIKVIDLVKPFLETEGKSPFEDPRVRLETADPRTWIKEHHNRYDAIIQTLSDPQNASLNRLFTEDFFKEARAALRPEGIIAFSMSSSANYLPPEVAYTNASILKAVSSAFEFVSLIPGSRMTVLASESPIPLKPRVLETRYRRRKLKNKTVVPSNFIFYLQQSRRNALRMRLQSLKHVISNTDFYPVSYFLAWRVWLSKFVSPVHMLGPVAVIWAMLWALGKLWRMRKELARAPESVLLLAVGFSSMCLELTLLLAFQAVSGSLYWQLGILMASFMAGLAIGSGAASFPACSKKPQMVLEVSAVFLCLLCAFLWLKLPQIMQLGSRTGLLIFCSLLAGAGLAVGAAFVSATRIAQTNAGTLYAADLWGSALGAFAAGAFLVPIIGLQPTMAVSALALVPPILFVIWTYWRPA